MFCGPSACGCCGHDLTGEPVRGVQKLQVFEASPPPPPTVTEYQVQEKLCPACGAPSTGVAPAGVTGRVQYGPGVHTKAALATCANYLPVARAAKMVAAYTGVNVSAGFVAGVRGKAAARLGPFMDRVRELLRAAADDQPRDIAHHIAHQEGARTIRSHSRGTGRTMQYLVDGTLLPCWSWAAHPELYSQCRLAYFDHAAVLTFALVRMGLASLMVAGASWRVPCWPGFLTG